MKNAKAQFRDAGPFRQGDWADNFVSVHGDKIREVIHDWYKAAYPDPNRD